MAGSSRKIAYYPGSFDPMTYGHLDILNQALSFADEVVVAIGIHPGKKPMLDFDERANLIGEVIAGLDDAQNIRVEAFDGLVVDAAKSAGASMLIRGVRDGSDLDYELQMAGMNGAMAPSLATVFLAAQPRHRAITATLVRQIAGMGGDVSSFVPKPVLTLLNKKFR